MRAETLAVKGNEYLEAARSCGASEARIILRHVFPNAMSSTIVNVTLGIGTAMLRELIEQAQKAGVIILLVFHQPRSLVLKRIQNVILMGPQANILYSGPISQAERYFSQFAITNRHEYSDSDYLLDVVCVFLFFCLSRASLFILTFTLISHLSSLFNLLAIP